MLNEEATFNPVTPYGTTKVLVERDVAALADDTFSPDIPPECHGVRHFAADAVRPGPQQPCRMGLHDRARLLEERRYAVAPHRPHRGYLPCLPGGPSRAAGDRSQPGLQCRDQQGELPDPRTGRDRQGDGSRLPDRIRRGRGSRQAVLPGRFRQSSSDTFPEYALQWDARRGAQQLYEAYRKIGLRQEDFEGPRYKRIDHIKKLLSSGQLDETLRWTQVPDGTRRTWGIRERAPEEAET